MPAKLYGLSASHPAHAAEAMLVHKRIDYERTDFPPGMHPVALRLVGFSGRTVPALRIDGRRLQGSLVISRALEEIKPEPPLFPQDRRAAVEDAEEWGERNLQPLPRRFFRWGVAHHGQVRRWMAEESGMPLPALVAPASVPVSRWFAHLSQATDENTRAGLKRLPELLDDADGLIAAGTIGREGEPNAADFQIGSSVAVLTGFADLRALAEDRPVGELARRLFPRRPAEVPPFLPQEWLPRG